MRYGTLGRQDIAVLECAAWSIDVPIDDIRAIAGDILGVLFAFDREGVFTLSEGGGLAVLGRRPGEVVDRSIFDVYRPRAPDRAATSWPGG